MKIHISFIWYYVSNDVDLGSGSSFCDVYSFDEMKELIREKILTDGIHVTNIDIAFDDKIHIYADEEKRNVFDISVYAIYGMDKFRIAHFSQDIFDYWHSLDTYLYPDLD